MKTSILSAALLVTGTLFAQVQMQGLGDKVCPVTGTVKLGDTAGVSIQRTTLGSRNGKLTCVYQGTEMVWVETTKTQCRDVPVLNVEGPLFNLMKYSQTPSVSYMGSTPVGGKCKVKPMIKLIQK